MGPIILGTVGFFLYFIYDINSIVFRNAIMQKLFAAGSLCVAISAVWGMKDVLSKGTRCPAAFIGFGTGSVFFLILLVYTLFFALPFGETYCEENKVRMAYTEGVYSLCRHPGVLWFAGLYFCLWGWSGELSKGGYFLTMIAWNYLYIIFQDLWTFPKTFSNYEEYKKTTPFLLPNKRSIEACFVWIKRRKRRPEVDK